jgi:hypothetical protein
MTTHDTARSVANPNRTRNLSHDDFAENDTVNGAEPDSDQAA